MIELISTPTRSGQVAYIDATQEHVVRREAGYGQQWVYRFKGDFVDKDEFRNDLAQRHNLNIN